LIANKKLKSDLLNHLKVTPGRLSQILKNIKQELGPMSTEDATYVKAHQEGFDLTKYLENKIVDRIRDLLKKTSINSKPSYSKTKGKFRSTKHVFIKLQEESSLKILDALLSTTLAKDAQKMAIVYPKYYILENSIRVVIKRILENIYATNWWITKVQKDVRDNVKDRMDRESKQPWHGKRGQHEIFYSNFGDLKRIIINNWNDFKDLFPSQAWIAQKLDELEHPRNVMAHHNPVSKIDEKRIDLYLHDWIALIKSKNKIIP